MSITENQTLEKLIKSEKLHQDLTESIIGCSFDVMNELGAGFLESVYRRSLAMALVQKGLIIDEEVSFDIYFRGQRVGHYIADLIVERKVIIELKCCKCLLAEHQAQVINYLKATGLSVGLLINFGQFKIEWKRLYHPFLQM